MASPGKPFPNVKTTQEKVRLGGWSTSSPGLPPEVVGPKCQVRKEAEKALKFPAKSGVCVSEQVLRPVKRGGEAGVGTESSGRD